MPDDIRLNVFMAKSGIASRRKCDEIISSGRVFVNGQVVNTLGYKVKSTDEVMVDGIKITKEELVYYVLNKPRGYVSTTSDEFNRKTVMELFPKEILEKRIFPIGRLDYDTQGVLLFTNDGELSNRLIHPRFSIEKEYLVRVDGIVTKEMLAKLCKGVIIDGYKTKSCLVSVKETNKENNSSLIDMVITEGKNHQVKKMCEAVGLKVKHLTRIRFAFIDTTGLGKGDFRPLKIHEIKKLYNL